MKNSSDNQTYFESAAENKRVLIVDGLPIAVHAITCVLRTVDLSSEIVIKSLISAQPDIARDIADHYVSALMRAVEIGGRTHAVATAIRPEVLADDEQSLSPSSG